MPRIVAILFAALIGPILFVAACLLLAHLANWHMGGAATNLVLLGGVLAGVAPVLFAPGLLWTRLLIAALYAIPCSIAVGYYWLLLNCSMFRQCLS